MTSVQDRVDELLALLSTVEGLNVRSSMPVSLNELPLAVVRVARVRYGAGTAQIQVLLVMRDAEPEQTAEELRGLLEVAGPLSLRAAIEQGGTFTVVSATPFEGRMLGGVPRSGAEFVVLAPVTV